MPDQDGRFPRRDPTEPPSWHDSFSLFRDDQLVLSVTRALTDHPPASVPFGGLAGIDTGDLGLGTGGGNPLQGEIQSQGDDVRSFGHTYTSMISFSLTP